MSCKASLAQVADYFISLSNETGELISNLKLQKLVYYAQTWHLGLLGEPLFEEELQAWVHGPVVPELYNQYKHHGWQPLVRIDLVEGSFKKTESEFNTDTQQVLASICKLYFTKGDYEMELMSHAETPWIRARGNCEADEICTEVIDKAWMQEWAAAYVVAFA